jgi:adenylate kinase family enzyme
MLVLLTNQGATLPQELTHDILVLDEPLPSLETLEKIVRDTFESAGMTAPDADTLKLATDALIGLPFFPAEQSTAMCLDTIGDEGLNISDLWDRKRQQINQTNGLSVGTGKESLAEIGGLENVKEYMERLLGGNDAPRCIIFSDEIEKAFAGTGTDMSGVKTALTGAMLSWTQDQDMSGVLWFGVPGGGKSQLGKAIAAHHNIPFIKFDLDGMQSGIVGSSGSNLRSAQATVDAVASGKVLWIATCNSVDALPAELQARFKDGSFFFDTPTKEERATIWAIYRSKFGIPATDATPSDEGWTGREIKECCSKAYRLRLSLEAASKYVVPVTISRADLIENIRRNASGKYISASQPGLYHYAPPQSHAIATTAHQEAVTGRKMRNE